MSMSAARILVSRTVFVASSTVAVASSGILFRDLTDFSQWFTKPNRSDLMTTYMHRHEYFYASLAGSAINTVTYWTNRRALNLYLWAGTNVVSLGLLFVGYYNNELMMRPRGDRNALYLSTCQASKMLKPTEMAIVTQLPGQEPRCFPDTQISRPHVVLVGSIDKPVSGSTSTTSSVTGNGDATTDQVTEKVPVQIAFCALTGTGIVYETPDFPDGTPKQYFPLTQLENNLVLMERNSGHIGHQINGIDETRLLQAMGEDVEHDMSAFDKVGRRPSQAFLAEAGVEPATEVASWRMTVGNFNSKFPLGRVFINDYKEFPDLKHKPVLTVYDKIMDLVFKVFIGYHNVSPNPIFPTVDNVDPRLQSKERVWGFNVGDDYACVTEDFVKAGKNMTRNMTLGGTPLVASYDPDSESLGIFVRPSPSEKIESTVDVYGNVKTTSRKLSSSSSSSWWSGRKKEGKGDIDGTIQLERLNTVKNGLFWFAWQNFFPQTKVNPTE